MKGILCLNKISSIGLKALPQSYEVVESLDQAVAVLVRSANMHEMSLPEHILAVARAGAGVNNIPLDAYAEKGVVVFNTPGANANAVKELTLAGMFLAARNIDEGMQWIKSNKDDEQIAKTIEKVKSQFAGTEIFGKTIGIIGLGAIGMQLAEACCALGMKVIGTKRNLKSIDQTTLPKQMTLVPSIDEMLPLCDFVSLNMPLNAHTKHMFSKTRLEKMKPGAILLNFARDALVQDQDLEQALISGHLRKYVTDFPNYQTANMQGVIAIPHLGASSEEAEDNCAYMASEQVSAYIEHGNIINSVNYPNVFLGEKKEFNRVTILFKDTKGLIESIVKMLEIDFEIMRNVYDINGDYGYAIFDVNQKIEENHIKNIEALQGVIRARII